MKTMIRTLARWAVPAILLLCCACAGKTPGASSSASPADSSQQGEAPLSVAELTVELPRDLDTAAARAAMASLQGAMAEQGVEIGTVSVTFGTSYAATATALTQGGVDLAFLPAEDYLRFADDAVLLLADARQTLAADGADISAWNTGKAIPPQGSWAAGTYALMCTAPTDYGQTLTSLWAKRTPSWAELDHARWGVLDRGSAAGYRCVELWLQDHYEDNGVADLKDVTVYSSWEELLRAASAGEIDVFPIPADLRADYEAVWTADSSRTDSAGVHGFGRSESIYAEVQVAAVTERLYAFVAAAAPGDTPVNTDRFAQALETALPALFPGPAEQKAAIGAERYARAASEDLNGLRRLLLGGD